MVFLPKQNHQEETGTHYTQLGSCRLDPGWAVPLRLPQAPSHRQDPAWGFALGWAVGGARYSYSSQACLVRRIIFNEFFAVSDAKIQLKKNLKQL